MFNKNIEFILDNKKFRYLQYKKMKYKYIALGIFFKIQENLIFFIKNPIFATILFLKKLYDKNAQNNNKK